MDFGKFWDALESKLVNCDEFETLRRSEPFEARKIGDCIIITPESSEKPRNPCKDEFRHVWDIMKDVAVERYVNKYGRYSDKSRNSSYILTLIYHVVGYEDME